MDKRALSAPWINRQRTDFASVLMSDYAALLLQSLLCTCQHRLCIT